MIDRHRKKMSAGASLMRGLGKCRGEFSLMTLSYNFKRVMNVLGEAAFAEHCLQKQRLGANGV